MSHYIIVRSAPYTIIGSSELLAKLRRACNYPYTLDGSGGLWKVTTEDEEHCTKLEFSLSRMVGIEVVAVDSPYDGEAA